MLEDAGAQISTDERNGDRGPSTNEDAFTKHIISEV